MRGRKVCRLVALGVMLSAAVGLSVARNAWADSDDRHDSRGPGRSHDERARDDVCKFDPSDHKVSFVTVAPGVQLEVLDWGGKGDVVVLLTGLGDNAHVYDQFAYQFTDRFRVIGITRRGFGASSQPSWGYDLATRARDDIAVLDKLKIREAIFIGHSVAGTEMNKLGAVYPGRVKKIVYLDAKDLGGGGWVNLPQPPLPPDEERDFLSVQNLSAGDGRDNGFRKPLASICEAVITDRSGKIIKAVTPPDIPKKMIDGLEPAEYGRIRAPVLGILNVITPQLRAPYYWYLDPAARLEYDRSIAALSEWDAKALERFRTIANARVITLRDANHYVYIVDEALVVREVRKFLLGE